MQNQYDQPLSSASSRKIIHLDMDAYFAAIEVKDNPALQGKPLVVGGLPNTRSVVATASYEARKFGIRSAMPCNTAAKLCPQVIFVPPRFERYKAISQHIREIFFRYTPLVEPLSLDEAYLDVTQHTQYAIEIAKEIKQAIKEELALTCSAGIGPNKLIAKIASDYRKPDGLTVVRPHQVKDFIGPLSVRKIHGVGPAAEAKLHQQGIFLCQDVWAYSAQEMHTLLGSWGEWIWHAAQGQDERAVEPHWERKSYGKEDTFAEDITHLEYLITKIHTLAQQLHGILQREEIKARTLTLKVKYHNFETITRRLTLAQFFDSPSLMTEVAETLLREKTEAGVRPIRLIGLSLSNFQEG